ncbi:MAG: Verru_Chthon cassette protein A [Chthoniobacteraceae bacterium]
MKSLPPPTKTRPAGFALVLVLTFLVLLAGLTVGFLCRVTTERASTFAYHSAGSAHQLADTAVSLVQGQIHIATTRGANVAWASQPGMIRTFDVNGNLLNAYKLYSAPAMISGSVPITNGTSTDMPPLTWSTDTALWTDLNAPVEIEGVKIFPILDPSASGTTASTTGSAVEGYSITSVPGSSTYQPIPMPVQWLYKLRDGTMVAPTKIADNMVTVAGETTANPIVGRIAFWADDDTCKVNVNTASEGTYWAPPVVSSTYAQYALATYQPAQHEFQRYPGHPAMTCLSSALPNLTANQIYSIVPRVVGGGSEKGTTTATSALTSDTDRLYASVDELIFDGTSRSSNAGLTKSQLETSKFFLTAHSRAPETNLFNLPRVACWPIYQLNANGTADLNYTTAYDRLIAFCSTVNSKPYCFQRKDHNSTTEIQDISRNTQLYSYLQYLTTQTIPGFGNSFHAKYPNDRDQILTEIFDYIRCMDLQDALLSSTNRYTNGFPSTWNASMGLRNVTAGYGWVAPTHYTPSGTPTMGFGRYYTISKLGIVFICNASPDDPSSNVASGTTSSVNLVLNGTPLVSNTSEGIKERYIQALIFPEFFCPSLGFVGMVGDMRIQISGLENLTVNGSKLFSTITSGISTFRPNGLYDNLSRFGAQPGYRAFGFGNGGGMPSVGGNSTGYSKDAPARGNLPADSTASSADVYPFISDPIKISDATTGPNTMTFSGGGTPLTIQLYTSATSSTLNSSQLIQTIQVRFPANVAIPVPNIVTSGLGTNNAKQNWWAFNKLGCMSPVVSGTGTTFGTQGRLFMITQKTNAGGLFVRPDADTIRTMEAAHGDFRLAAASNSVGPNFFQPHRYYSDTSRRMAASLTKGPGSVMDTSTMPNNDCSGSYLPSASPTVTYPPAVYPDISAAPTQTPQSTGDFDNGIAWAGDGPYINKPDEGEVNNTASYIPYFSGFSNGNAVLPTTSTFFSPNRQMPSPGMFGSLSTGVISATPWQTLLFRPQTGHPGAQTPKDHLLLDLFWMPVVEPYAISDRFSTAGKINMNYQILPFTYITRSTGLYALFKSEKVAALSNTTSSVYKGGASGTAFSSSDFWFPIDQAATLAQFQTKFAQGSIFKSASEICDVHIIPANLGQTAATMPDFWASHALTGDNLRERIYTTLYPRLTTKSNTYTVHFRAQALHKSPNSTPGTWTEGRDLVTGEYRGSTTIERFINSNSTAIPDYAGDTSQISGTNTLDNYYKWRVVENRQFAP